MIINRRTFNIKPGCMKEEIRLGKAEAARAGRTSTFTVAIFGPFDKQVTDFPFESVAEYEQFWHGWGASPEATAFSQNVLPLIISGGRQ